MNPFKKLFTTATKKTRAHVCYYDTPIVSQYYSFNARKIIFQCECGAKEQRVERQAFDRPFSIPTTNMITDKQMSRILNNKNVL